MADYTITAVSKDEPRRYDGPNGTVFYIKVKLDGHDKPVSIGKKSPDALKAGDVVSGTITETQYDADKFTAEKKAFTPSGSKSYQPRDDSAIQAQWAINQSREYIQFQLGDKATLAEILDTAKLFYGMIEQVKGSTPAVARSTEQSKPAWDAARDRFKPAIDEQTADKLDDPEFASLVEEYSGF